jgi:hypothetical protein
VTSFATPGAGRVIVIKNVYSSVALDDVRSAVAKLQCDIANGPVASIVTPKKIRRYLASHYGFTKPVALNDVVADVERMLRTWQVQVTHPRYFGLFNPSVTLASIVADTLVAMYNPQLATWRTSPAANEIERHTLTWLAGKFGLPANAVANFTGGGAESNCRHRRVDPGFPGLRRRWASAAVRIPDYLPHGRSPSWVRENSAYDGNRAPGAPQGSPAARPA